MDFPGLDSIFGSAPQAASSDVMNTLAATLGLGFLSGFRLYATVLALGLAIRFDLLHLGESMKSLAVLSDNRVLIAAGAMGALEFLADKVAWIDSAWDTVHTVIRPVAATLLAATALGNMDPLWKVLLALLAGGVALTSHSTKAATRLVVNHSPEPFSNVALSFAEDLAAPVGLWVVWQYPGVFLTLLALFLILFFLLAPRLWRALRLEFAAAAGLARKWFGEPSRALALPPAALAEYPPARRLWSVLEPMMDTLPEAPARTIEDGLGVLAPPVGVRAAGTKSVPGLRRSIGYLCFTGYDFVFVTRRWLRPRLNRIAFPAIRDARLRRGFLLDELVIETTSGIRGFDLFKTATRRAGAQVPVPAATGEGVPS